jgi:type I restriction enzyme R subunit
MDAHSDLSAQILNNPVVRDNVESELIPAIYRRLRAE